MRILMLTPYLPYPPSSGGQIRSYNLIKQLYKKHEITLFSLIKDEKEKKHVRRLEKFCRKVKTFKRSKSPWTLRNILLTGLGPYPFLVIRNLSPGERRAIKKELNEERYDLIHAETFYVMPHIPTTDTPVLLVEQTIEYRVYQHYVDNFPFWPLRPLLYMDVFKLKLWESKFWRKAARVVAVSRADKKKMQELVPDLEVGIVPNGAGEDLLDIWDEREPEQPPIIFYQGNFDWLQNTEAARILVEEVFTLIKKKISKAKCWIVGQNVRGKVEHLAGKGVEIKELKSSDVEGVREAYRKASIFIAPLAGPGGTRLKILGAMAAGVPVVTTSTGIEGIDAKDGKEVWVRDDSRQMAEAAIRLIENKRLYRETAAAARELVERKYRWEGIGEKLDRIYKEVGRGG